MLENFQMVLNRLTFNLRPVMYDGLLNEEGVRTVEACDRLSEMIGFHDSIEEYLEDETVKRIFEDYSDCRKIRNAKSFLDKKFSL